MGDALGGIEDIMREKKRIKEKARATASVGFGKLTGLMDRIEKKITTDLVSNIAEKKVLAEIKRTKLQLEKEVMTDNIQNEVNYTLIRMFDDLNQPEPKCDMKFEGFQSQLDDYRRQVQEHEKKKQELERQKTRVNDKRMLKREGVML